MGYEINYKYHEEISKGEYNREETKTKTIKVGTPYEDMPLESLAGKIMAQLARRNILVVDVEIFEYTKKKINYRETPDGVVIKNKKFSFDDGPVVSVNESETEEQSPEQMLATLLANPQVQAALAGNQVAVQAGVPAKITPGGPLANKKQNILRHEIFNPVDKIFLEDARRRGFSFTLGKRYPILGEKMGPNMMVGMIYTVVDDNGKTQKLSDKFFTPDVALSEGFRDDFKPLAGGGRTMGDTLDWGGAVSDDIPDIRRG
jgi:hypothetical protein